MVPSNASPAAEAVQIGEQTQANDPLKLRNCPNCEYSLESLPPAGVCPECGTRYDERFVILQDGKGTEAEPLGRKTIRYALAFVVTVLLARMAYFVGRRDPVGLVWFIPIAITLVAYAWQWMLSATAARKQLWMCELGFVLRSSTQEGRATDRMLQRMNVWAMPLIACLLLFRRGERWPETLGALVPLGLVALLITCSQRHSRKTSVRVEHFEPLELTRWRSLDRCELTELRPGWFRIRLRRVMSLGRWKRFHHEWCAVLCLPLSTDQAAELTAHLNRWLVADGCDIRVE